MNDPKVALLAGRYIVAVEQHGESSPEVQAVLEDILSVAVHDPRRLSDPAFREATRAFDCLIHGVTYVPAPGFGPKPIKWPERYYRSVLDAIDAMFTPEDEQ